MDNRNIDDEYDRYLDKIFDKEEHGVEGNNIKDIKDILDEAEKYVIDIAINNNKLEGVVYWFLDQYLLPARIPNFYRLSKYLESKKDVRILKILWRGALTSSKGEFWTLIDGRNYLIKIKSKYYTKDSKINYRIEEERESTLRLFSEYKEILKRNNLNDDLNKVLEEEELFKHEKKRKKLKARDKRKITEDIFWELIDEAIESDKNDIDFKTYLVGRLIEFGPAQIINFEKIFQELDSKLYTWEHWALAYIIRRGCGDDAFDYFRAWVIAQGKGKYYSVLNMNIDKLKNIFQRDPQFESFLYIAESAYGEVSDSIFKVKTKNKKITGKKWDEEDLPNIYPELYKIFE
ncbi:MAG: DUF4240 domain-containing protein [Candidatus Atribacteria bacterium]|nr:DUF4240 domain-containing protein [Candidatus Atribacteria bacterium]